MKMGDIIKDDAYQGTDDVLNDMAMLAGKHDKMVIKLVVYRDSNGIHVYDEEGNKLNVGLPRMEEALDYVANLIREYKKL